MEAINIFLSRKKISKEFEELNKKIETFSKKLEINGQEQRFLYQELTELKEKNRDLEMKLSNSIDKQKLLINKYSNEIKLAIKQRIDTELSSTDIKGNLVRYNEDINILFPVLTPKKLLVTATMSAGKSTVINALVGKEILKSRNEATTGKVYHVLNSMVENKESNRLEDFLLRGLKDEEVEQQEESNSEENIYLGTIFNSDMLNLYPLEIIDTPGVNYFGDNTHKKITEQCIKSLEYDLILYVINATQNGVTDDMDHLTELNKIDKPILFILNKVDEYNIKKDSIEETIGLTTKFLEKIGFVEPEVIPISAYAGLLAKKVINDIELTEFEKDDFELFIRKFNKYNPFNLDKVTVSKNKKDLANALLVNSGIERLEKKILEF